MARKQLGASAANDVDATNKSYVDSIGMLKPVRVADNGSGQTYTISGGNVTQIAGTTINGISLSIGDRVLIQGAPASSGVGSFGSSQPGNGIYKVTSNTTNISLTRDSDMSGSVKPAGLSVAHGQFGNIFTVGVPNDPSASFTYGTGNIQWYRTGNSNAATLTDTQILTNKTINGGADANSVGVSALNATGTASSTTYLRGDGAWVTPSGSGDASTTVSSSTDNTVALFNSTTGKSIKPATTTGIAKLTSGVLSTVAAPSGAIVGDTDAQTLTSKILTNPKINTILDTSGNTSMVIDATASAVNYLGAGNNNTGNAPTLYAGGADTDIALSLSGKGTGHITNYVGSQTSGTYRVVGSQTNIDLNLSGKGSGVVKANSVQIVDISTAQTLTNKIITEVVTTSSATTLTLANTTSTYVFTGSTATVWTLPALSGNTGLKFNIKNRGTANITLQRAGSDNLYSDSIVTSIVIGPSVTREIVNDASYWLVTSSGTITKFSTLIGDGVTTAIAVTHNLGTQDCTYSIRDASTNAFVDCDVVSTSTSTMTFTFATAPLSSAYKVVIVG